MKDLVNELQEVTDWFQLGLSLRVPESVLRTIQQDLITTNKCRQEMLIEWMKQEVPKWSTIVKALLDAGMTDQAIKIALIHFGRLNTKHGPCTTCKGLSLHRFTLTSCKHYTLVFSLKCNHGVLSSS